MNKHHEKESLKILLLNRSLLASKVSNDAKNWKKINIGQQTFKLPITKQYNPTFRKWKKLTFLPTGLDRFGRSWLFSAKLKKNRPKSPRINVPAQFSTAVGDSASVCKIAG